MGDEHGRSQHPGFSIGVAARAVGLHPQTLREYERHGLVAPVRTPGGTRRYREQELARLHRIVQLTTDGVSLAGVRFVLGLEDRVGEAEHRAAELEQLLEQHAPDALERYRRMLAARRERITDAERARRQRQATSASLVARSRSMSLEIVHVPRAPRSPRWRNLD